MNLNESCLYRVAIAIIFILSMAVKALAAEAKLTTNITEGFTLNLPPELSVNKKQLIEDFVIYEITGKGKAVAFIYVGDNPAFPGKTNNAQMTPTRLKGRNFEFLTFWKEDRVIGREMLFNLKGGEYLHAWTANTSGHDYMNGEKALFSIMVEQ